MVTLRLLRKHALGDFQQMVQAIARDPAMLIYLDSATNRKSHPNENFARNPIRLLFVANDVSTVLRSAFTPLQHLAQCLGRRSEDRTGSGAALEGGKGRAVGEAVAVEQCAGRRRRL